MSHHRVIVLKFGGSVLRDERSMSGAVHEIYRWQRLGYQVVAVVSALLGRTDELLARAGVYGGDRDCFASAFLAATGELESAALLALALDRAGVRAAVADPSAIGLKARGGVLEATPCSVNAPALRLRLERRGVIVVPGFIARDAESDEIVLLGRGGSDLTAIFLASELTARCRLLKDVNGLYEWDPADRGRPFARRFAHLDWRHAREVGGEVLQPRAVQFAEERRFAFEIASVGAVRGTEVRARASHVFHEEPEQHSPLRVVLLGCGTVGGGVWEHLRRMPERFEITCVVVRNVEHALARGVPRALIETDPIAAASSDDADVVIELMGGLEPGATAVRAALKNGFDVITANKRLIAEHGETLHGIAHENGVTLRSSAAVGGAAPVLEAIGRLAPRGIREVTGILNGTVNFMLDRMSRGSSFAEALNDARNVGFAEADASRDLSGADAADKLALIAYAIGVGPLAANSIAREALTASACSRIDDARANGCVLKQIARLTRDDQDRILAQVAMEQVPAEAQLGRTGGPWNAVEIATADGVRHIITGRGAGRWPTAEAVIADVFDLHRARTRSISSPSADVRVLASSGSIVPERSQLVG